MASSCPTEAQPPDIEELCMEKPPRAQQRRRTMTLQEKDLKQNGHVVRGLPRSASDMNVVAICTCQQSKDFPFCDNTHTIFNKATNSKMAPLYVAFVDGDQCNNCGSKDKNKLAQSLDQALPLKRGTQITRSNTIHNSADRLSTSCCCKQVKQSPDTLLHTSTPSLNEKTHTHDATPTSITSTLSSPDTTPIPSSLISSPSPSPSPSLSPSPSQASSISSSPSSTPIITPISPTITKEETTTTDLDDCNTTRAAYVPSNVRSPMNQKNIITRAEVAEHAAQNDLWMIIKGNVYDITDYVQYHPGGVRALVKFAGQDGTENVHYHSSRMLEILNSHYFIGKLPKHEGGGGGGCTIS